MGLQLPDLQEINLIETIVPLKNYARAVAAFSSQFIPYNKIRKGNTLKVSHRGLSTQSIPYYSRDELIYFEMELDFMLQSLWIRVGEDERQIPFYQRSEEDFYFATKEMLNDFGFNLKVELNTFNDDSIKTVSPQATEEILKILHLSSYSLKRFRSEVSNLTTSVQFRPQYFDQILSVITNLKTMQDESKRETVDFGFSFGDEQISQPHFYATTDPFPKNLFRRALIAPAYWYKKEKKCAVLHYSDIINSLDPVEDVINFYKFIYSKILFTLS